jgi:site-specific DNA-methyltransferase (cytosine-N4-specific)
MLTHHKIIFGNSQTMPELADGTVQLMVTSPPYPMIKMWDSLFVRVDPTIAQLWQKLEAECKEQTVTEIYDAMHEYLAKVWQEAYRVLADGGIACINIGDATRRLNGKFKLFANHSRIMETFGKIGFVALPYILWKKPTTKPKYKGKGAFLGSGLLPPNGYITVDCEFILLFRKGQLRKFPPKDENRYESGLTIEQRNNLFTQIWTVKGIRQKTGELERRTAAYPYEIADRLTRMFSVKGDTVLDPFLGSATTTKAAIKNERNSIGYEIDEQLVVSIQKKINKQTTDLPFEVEFLKRSLDLLG